MEARRLKWWGWGFEDKTISLESRPILLAYLRKRLELPPGDVTPPVALEAIRIPPSLLAPEQLQELETSAGEGSVSIDDRDRMGHAMGQGYRDLIRLRTGRVTRAPDAVIYPEDEGGVRNVLGLAHRDRYAVVPFGGGTSVVGGVELPVAGDFAAVITVDLRRMHAVHEVDADSGIATVDAGIRGPLLEEALRRHGLTFPHLPQSWEFSTLGGWIATRSSGALSNRYGSIEDLVIAVRLVTPVRTLHVALIPRSAHGPGLKDLIIGSEGTLGIVTQATIRVYRLPAVERFASRLFPTFETGIGALRAMAHDDALPDMTYLSDEEETRFAAANAGFPAEGGGGLASRAIRFKGFSLGAGSLLLMGFQGSASRVSAHRRHAIAFAKASMSLGARPAETWARDRFEVPYLRDALLDRGVMVDTVETAAPWSRLLTVYGEGQRAMLEALWSGRRPGLVLCHVSHAYHDGASLYFTVLARQRPGDEIAQWQAVKDAATEAFLNAGGALSHHHGIGSDHAPFLARVIGEDGLVVLRALKRELDPEGIMNPGKLGLGEG